MSNVEVVHVETGYDNLSPISTFSGPYWATVVGSNGKKRSARGRSKADAIAAAISKLHR